MEMKNNRELEELEEVIDSYEGHLIALDVYDAGYRKMGKRAGVIAITSVLKGELDYYNEEAIDLLSMLLLDNFTITRKI